MNAQSNVQDKSGEPRPSVAVMEGKGFYNKHAAIPAAGGALALPLLEQAFALCSTSAVRAEFARQAATDWEAFLSFRATALRQSGRLVVALPALPENKPTGFATLMDQANAVLSDLVVKKVISTPEREQMALAIYPRSESDLLAPFSRDGRFHGLTVEQCSTFAVPDTVWEEYVRDKNAEALAKKRAGFFRAVFAPSLSQALGPKRHPEARLEFLAALEDGLRTRLVGHPVTADNLVRIIVLAKQAGE
jgi:salicylate 1-O-methyltransferase